MLTTCKHYCHSGIAQFGLPSAPRSKDPRVESRSGHRSIRALQTCDDVDVQERERESERERDRRKDGAGRGQDRARRDGTGWDRTGQTDRY